jgi:hypothetical protein
MRNRLILIASLLLACSAFGQTTTITGTIKDLTNTVVSSGKVVFTLKPSVDTTISGNARFTPGAPITCYIQGGGGLLNAAQTGPCVVTTNTSLTPAGTSYRVDICPFMACASSFNFYAINSSYDISTIVPTPTTGPAQNFADVFSNQNIGGAKSFVASPQVPTPAASDNSTNAVNSAWVKSQTSFNQIRYANNFAGSDLGAQINAADTDLSTNPGEIWVTSSGTISESFLTLSANHSLVCKGDNVTLTMLASANIKQSNGTRIRGCTFASTQTAAPGGFGEIYASAAVNVEVSDCTFLGGGSHIYYTGVSSFRISNTRHIGVTAVASPIAIINSNNGQVNNPRFEPFTFPVGSFTTRGALVYVQGSIFVEVSNLIATNIDASQISLGAGGIEFAGCTYCAVHGAFVSVTTNMDSILLETATGSSGPNTDIVIDGLVSVSNDNSGGVGGGNFNLGSCLDIIQSDRVAISNTVCTNSGNFTSNRQPEVFLFLDDYVSITNSKFTTAGEHGVEVFGTPHAHLWNNDYIQNQSDGVLVVQQTGTVTVAGGVNVTWTAGPVGGFSLAWLPGTSITIGGTTSQIASVTSNTALTLSTAVTNGASQAYTVGSYDAQLIGGSAMDNGTSALGINVYGIEFQGGSLGLISGMTIGDDRPSGSKTQIYGVSVSSGGSADLDNNDLNGGCTGCANATAAMNGATFASLPNVALAAGKRYLIQDSTAVSAEGQPCTGLSTHNAIAISDGTTWKCF